MDARARHHTDDLFDLLLACVSTYQVSTFSDTQGIPKAIVDFEGVIPSGTWHVFKPHFEKIFQKPPSSAIMLDTEGIRHHLRRAEHAHETFDATIYPDNSGNSRFPEPFDQVVLVALDNAGNWLFAAEQAAKIDDYDCVRHYLALCQENVVLLKECVDAFEWPDVTAAWQALSTELDILGSMLGSFNPTASH